MDRKEKEVKKVACVSSQHFFCLSKQTNLLEPEAWKEGKPGKQASVLSG
jgi:hypothetical protein